MYSSESPEPLASDAAALKCWANTGSCRFQLRRLPRIPCRNSTSGPDPSTETARRGAGSTKRVSTPTPVPWRRDDILGPMFLNMKLLAQHGLNGFGGMGEGMALQRSRDGRRVLWLAHESAPKNFTAVDVSEPRAPKVIRSEEHTSELQSPDHLVCR